MKKLLLSLGMVLLLAACASGVKLNDVPVEDKSGSKVSVAPDPVMPAPVTAASSANEAKSTVVPVDSSASTNLSAGPAGNVAKVIFFDYDSFVVKSEFHLPLKPTHNFSKLTQERKFLWKVIQMNVVVVSTTLPWAKSVLMQFAKA